MLRNPLFAHIVSKSNVEIAYQNTQVGRPKYKTTAILFSRDKIANLEQLVNEVIDNTYAPLSYVEFKVYEPKERIVHAPRYRDKVVQHMVNNVLGPYFNARFIEDSYACIQNKGNRRAVLKIQQYLYQIKQGYGETTYVVKADVAKFFYSIDRGILKTILKSQLKCERTYRLLEVIIDSSPGYLGLPLGNLTSQLLANVYMNCLDQYCKRELRLKRYVRYADDIFVVCKNKEEAALALKHITVFCRDYLKLVIHPNKSNIQPIDRGLDALGFKIYPNRIKLKRSSKVRIDRHLRKIPDRALPIERKKIEERINGWLNFANLGEVDFFVMNLLEKYPRVSVKDARFYVVDHRSG